MRGTLGSLGTCFQGLFRYKPTTGTKGMHGRGSKIARGGLERPLAVAPLPTKVEKKGDQGSLSAPAVGLGGCTGKRH